MRKRMSSKKINESIFNAMKVRFDDILIYSSTRINTVDCFELFNQ